MTTNKAPQHTRPSPCWILLRKETVLSKQSILTALCPSAGASSSVSSLLSPAHCECCVIFSFLLDPLFGQNNVFTRTFRHVHRPEFVWWDLCSPGKRWRICVQITTRDTLSTPTISISTSIRPTESVRSGRYSTRWWEMMVGGNGAVIS